MCNRQMLGEALSSATSDGCSRKTTSEQRLPNAANAVHSGKLCLVHTEGSLVEQYPHGEQELVPLGCW